MKQSNQFSLLYVEFATIKNSLQSIVTSILLRFLLSFSIIFFSSVCFSVPNIQAPQGPAFITADYVEYNEEEDFIYVKGNIKVTIDQYTVTSDLILYNIQKDQLLAKGGVKIYEGRGKILIGETVVFKDKLKAGIISDFILKFNSNNALLVAKLAKRYSQNQAYLYNTIFTPCTVTCGNKPIWQLSAQETHLDFDNEKMTYKNMFFEVYGLPIFFTPYFSHLTPDAKAQSGVLIFSIKRNNLSIPIYWRAKPNMDFTLTPRFSEKYTIFELEGRHKILNGDYEINSSYGHVPYKSKKVDSAYVSAHGNFCNNDYKYGFNVNRTSDKAYLKNYHDKYDSYLSSSLYFNNVEDYDYLILEGMYFQGLRVEDSNEHDPLILPKIRTKNVISLNENESTYLVIQNDILNYHEPQGKQMGRGFMNLSLTNNAITPSGHLFNFTARNRGDLYFIRNINKEVKGRKTKSRNIPELQAIWRYPLVNQFNYSSITLEPIISATLGRKFQERYNGYGLIDPSQYEIAEDNLFDSNRYSGIDYHEYGKRLSYGVNSGVLSGSNYYDLFLGQFLHKYNTYTNDNMGNIGKFSVNMHETVELFYRFRRDKHYKPIRDEVGMDLWYEKLQLTTTFINLENIKKYYSTKNFSNLNNRATQTYYNLQYQLSPNWLISHELRLDMSAKKIHPLYKSIKVTYFKDCVSMALKLYDDYTFDNVRGIKKIHNKSISVGLKVLNM